MAYMGLAPQGARRYVGVSAELHFGYQMFSLNSYRLTN